MTTHEAKADARRRLQAAGVPFTKLTAKTVGLQDLARCSPVFVTLHGVCYPGTGDELKAALFAGRPKPSAGGYVVNFKDYRLNTPPPCTTAPSPPLP